MKSSDPQDLLANRIAYSPDEAAILLGISRSSFYAALDRGEIRSVRVGHRRLIPRRALDQLLDAGVPDAENEQRPGGHRGVEHVSAGTARHADPAYQTMRRAITAVLADPKDGWTSHDLRLILEAGLSGDNGKLDEAIMEVYFHAKQS